MRITIYYKIYEITCNKVFWESAMMEALVLFLWTQTNGNKKEKKTVINSDIEKMAIINNNIVKDMTGIKKYIYGMDAINSYVDAIATEIIITMWILQDH